MSGMSFDHLIRTGHAPAGYSEAGPAHAALDWPFEVTPISGGCGAVIHGVDLSKPLDARMVRALREAMLEYVVIQFHDQTLEPDGLRSFGELFGEIEPERFIPAMEGHQGVHILRGISKSKLTTQNLIWHVDHSYKPVPSMAAALYAVDVPDKGGDTLFSNMYAAYDALSDKMKDYLEGLEATHDVVTYGLKSGLFDTMERRAAIVRMPPPSRHPLICTHPETGRKMIFVNQAWTTDIVGLDPHESKHLLNFLFEHTTQHQFQCRVHWKNGSLAIWDNRACQHRGIPDYDGPRIMHRIAIAGDWAPGGKALPPKDAAHAPTAGGPPPGVRPS